MTEPDPMFEPLDVPVPASPSRPAAGTWQPIMPAPLPLPETIRHARLGTASVIWRYTDARGALLFAVARFDLAGGGKDIRPYSCGSDGWRFKLPPGRLPPYGLDRLAARPDVGVLVVEGEKAADAAQAMFAELVCVTWQGGAKAPAKTDWAGMKGRRMVLWPDNDHDGTGLRAAECVAKLAREAGAASVGIVDVPADWPDGWDLADPLPDAISESDLREMIKAAEQASASPWEPAAALRADIARAADMDREQWVVSRRAMATQHGVQVGELDALRATELAKRMREKEADAPRQRDPRNRADLEIFSADLPDTARELAVRLARLPNLFDREGPVRVQRDETRGGAIIEPLTVNSVVLLAHRIARPWMWSKSRNGDLERRDITLQERVARLYLEARDEWGLRPLDGVTTAPLLSEDGSIRVAEGYDEASRLWCEHVPFVDVPDAPTRADAESALHRLRRHFRTLAFADAERCAEDGAAVSVVDAARAPRADESAMLVALLTAIARPCLHLAPALLVRAPTLSGAGTGKGLLVRAIAAIALGVRPSAITAGGTAEELDKRLVTCLIEARPVLMLDNVNGQALKSDALAAAITERPARVRQLGRSATLALNSTCWITITGNGVTLSEDLARRFLSVELDAGTEDPEARPFVGDFLEDTFARRGELLAAALTIWRWGRQQGSELPRGRSLGSFEQWARWCRDPLLALGCADPVARVAQAKAQDPRRQATAEIFRAWWAAHGDSLVAISDLDESVVEVANPLKRNRQYLARRIRNLAGTRAAGFVLQHSPSEGRWSADKYALRRTDGAGAASGPDRSPAPGWVQEDL